MRAINKTIISAAAALLLSVTCLILFYGHIAVLILARSSNVDITYKHLSSLSINAFSFKGLNITEKNHGFGLSSSDGRITIIPIRPFPLNVTADFVLNNVRFIKTLSEKESSYSSIDDLVAIPFNSRWRYKAISGKMARVMGVMDIKDLYATGDQIRFSINGKLTKEDFIDADITIQFAREIFSRIPGELTNVMLKDESDGWKSLSLKIEGDMAKPSLRITSRLFRLSIGIKP